MDFASSISQGGDTVVVHPVGEVDRDTADQFLAALSAAVSKADPGGAVEVDLTGVSFLDSAGVGALLTGRKAALARTVRFMARDAQPAVHRILDITNVWTLLRGSTDER